LNGKAILSLFFTLFVLFILCSFLVPPVLSENENVVINEFELNPEGTDNCTCTREWVELYNPTSNNISIGSWIVTTSQGRNVTIPEDTVIATQGFYVITCYNWSIYEWLANENESIVLTDADGIEIDRTPVKSDVYDDDRTWSRVPDGQDNWVFQISTQGKLNIIPPKADFTFYPPNPTLGEEVQFMDLSQEGNGSIEKWLWEFGDGQTSGLQNPNHTYADARSYIVWLTVTDDNNATGKTWKEIVVTENATQPQKNATQLEMILPPTSIKVGQSLNITAILKDELGNPLEGETVEFYVDEEPIASKVTNSEGVASVIYIPTKPGLILVKASYNGSSQYTGSSKETFLTIEEEEKPDWTPYILGGTATGIILGSIVLMIKYRMKKKSPESEPHIQATDEEN